jgi:hypothetical protein
VKFIVVEVLVVERAAPMAFRNKSGSRFTQSCCPFCGRVLSRDLLLTDVWGYQYTGGTRTVDVHIRRLREKLPFLTDAIVTIKQFGYRLEEGVEGPKE